MLDISGLEARRARSLSLLPSSKVVVLVVAAMVVALVMLGSLGAVEAQAAEFEVNSTADPGVGTCDASECTLREAIEAANDNGEPDLIDITTAGTITLTQGQLTIGFDGGNEVRIRGVVEGKTDPDGNTTSSITTVDANGQSRVLTVQPDAEAEIVTLKVTDGNNPSGGGIDNRGTLTLNSSIVSGNTADSNGGGITNSGILTINGSTISGNTTTGDRGSGGGGIYNGNQGTLTVNRSTISDNSTVTSGGGIANEGSRAILTVNESTISGNTTTGNRGLGGGGIFNEAGDLTLTNSTISGNSTGVGGGGIHSFDGPASIEFATITNNTAPDGAGSGILAGEDAATPEIEVSSSIIAGNENSDVDSGADGLVVSQGYNVVGSGNATDAFDQPGDLANVSNPGLGPLADNGGLTKTHAVQQGSPAIDNVTESQCPPPDTDQRGFVRPQDGDTNGTRLCDAGSFEVQVTPQIEPSNGDFGEQPATTDSDPQTFTVTNTGEAPLQIDSLSIEGADADSFTLQNNGCEGSTLSSGESCQVGVVFSPQSEGAKNAQLVVESNAASSPDRVALTGTATGAPVDPEACTIEGTEGNDVLRGTRGRDVICGLGGNDVISGRGGDDLIRGGSGNDFLYGGRGADELRGEAGNDLLSGGRGRDLLIGGPGRDLLFGGPGRDEQRAGE